MKNILSLVFAGMIGGLIMLGGLYLIQSQVVNINPSKTSYANLVNHSPAKNNSKYTVPSNFTVAAEKAMPTVVHITASESKDMARKRREEDRGRYNDPFRNFFGDDFFFGNPNMPDQGKRGTGSGVIISKDGYIVTNNHVVGFADEVEVTTYDNRTFKAQIIGTDPQTDLAVIKIEEEDLPTLEFADSDAARVGEWVLAVGNPFDLTSTVTAGIISAKGRDIDIIGGSRSIEAFIQTDAAVNPGNSGGALVDTEGRLLGINTAIATQTGSFSGYSFAIPVSIMDKVVNDLIEFGSSQRAFLGINISEMDTDRSEELGIESTQGVFIEGLVDGGAAQYAGLQPQDVIIAVDQKKVKSVPQLQEIVGRAKVGETLKVTVLRNNKTKEIPVRLKAG